jgi:hydroxymethylpyrimidine/phosphomethylpyrimidine kinase
MLKYDCVLTIAGSDSGGGAGIQGDIKTISALGGYAATVITAITAQNTLGVQNIQMINTDVVVAQIKSVLSDIEISAIKIGMLGNAEIVQEVSRSLSPVMGLIPIIVDPVMVATSGDILLEQEAIRTLENVLLPKASLITPNIQEAQILAQRKICTINDMEESAIFLGKKYQTNILIKGGDLLFDSACDVLYTHSSQKCRHYPQKKIESMNTHGTGCSYSSAIATFLAKKETLEISIEKAKVYLTESLIAGKNYNLGKGHGPIHHFYRRN